MIRVRHRSAASIWLMLVLLTVASVGTVEMMSFARLSGLLIAVIAGIKGSFVILDFMEARHARPVWRNLYLGWLGAMSLVLVVLSIAG